MSKPLSNRIAVLILGFAVILPRLPVSLVNAVHYDAGAIWMVLDDYLKLGLYVPSRHPGSPLAEFVYSALRMLGEALQIPPHYLTNGAAMGFTIGSLFYFYRILQRWFAPLFALAITLLFNVHPQMLLFGGATSDMPMLLFFMAYATFAYLEGNLPRALVFSWIGCYCRIQGLALFVPLLWMWMQLEPGKMLKRMALAAVWVGLVFLPGLSYFGWVVFNPGFHGTMVTPHHKLGGFVYRSLNAMGPFGTLTIVVLWSKMVLRFTRVDAKKALFNPLFWTPILTLFVFMNAPWESFYLLPFVACATGFFFHQVRAYRFRAFLCAFFVLNFLSSTFVQVRFKPWKPPFIEMLPGTWKSHFDENFIVRGGG